MNQHTHSIPWNLHCSPIVLFFFYISQLYPKAFLSMCMNLYISHVGRQEHFFIQIILVWWIWMLLGWPIELVSRKLVPLLFSDKETTGRSCYTTCRAVDECSATVSKYSREVIHCRTFQFDSLLLVLPQEKMAVQKGDEVHLSLFQEFLIFNLPQL